MFRRFAPLFVVIALLSVATPAHAATKLEVSGWLPYWRAASSTANVRANFQYVTEVNPFGYSIKNDGTLADTAKLTQEPWASFIADAKKNKIRVVPTIMWSDGAATHRILSDTKKRRALQDEIVALVKEKGYDGIDINFEAKWAETKPYFSLFLKGLYQKIGTKWVMCTIEARTPLDSRYDSTPPADATMYANDYKEINKYCDRVRIMAYDQGSIDVKLNRARAAPYVPVSDPAWAEKTILEAAKTVSKKKLVLGIATYGYEYEVKPLSEYGYRYDRLWALNPKYATDLAAKVGATPVRNAAGELSFIYKSTGTTPEGDTIPISQNNDPNVAATLYSQAAFASTLQPPFNVVWWSDAEAIRQKVELAKKLGIRGVAFFKLDGGQDQGMWSALTPVR